MPNDDFVRSLGPAFLPHMLRRLSDLMVDAGTEWTKLAPALPPVRTHSTMFALDRHGELAVTELAALIRQSHPHALQWVKALEKLGLVARHRHPNDARRTMLRLTVKGAATMPAIHHARSVNEEVVRRLSAELGDDLWERLGRLEAILNDRSYIARMTEIAKSVGEDDR
ncbi:MarR family transcriptional regulator [Duganella sp. FT50W]|uniref:MarR family transcriptional regulator n=1 Tax=Duganella lactea TaxID=2692173 RepID=A0A6L8MN11_9BURK|nr:MarR family transcriptional regulator [Duganella lactea]MYM84283.1 MarR family transcriptional regulator [Duganella lactea]